MEDVIIKPQKFQAEDLSSDHDFDRTSLDHNNQIKTQSKPTQEEAPKEKKPMQEEPKKDKNLTQDEPKKEKAVLPQDDKANNRIGKLVEDHAEDKDKAANLRAKPLTGDSEPRKGAIAQSKEPKTSQIDSDLAIKANLATITNRVKKTPGESVSTAGGMRTPHSNSQASWPMESASRGNYGVYEKILESDAMLKNPKEIEAENKQLRQFLKDLNEQLQKHVERVKVTEYEGKKVEFKNKSTEEQMRTIIRELANNEKILAIKTEEYQKLEGRLDGIKDSTYAMNLQNEIYSVQMNIDNLKKENKRLALKNDNAGKDLDTIENVKGVPVSLEETQEKEREAKKFMQKLEQLKQRNAFAVEEKKKKLEKEKNLGEIIRKLERAYLGESGISEEIAKRHERMKKQMALVEEDLRITENRCKFKATQAERDLEELYIQNHKEREHIEKLEEIIREQAVALKEIISTESSKHGKSTQDIFENIRASLNLENRQKTSEILPALEEVKSGREAKGISISKQKSADKFSRGRDIQLDPILSYNDTSKQNITTNSAKHKNAVKRELGEKKSMWKESNEGDRARMDLGSDMTSPSKYKKSEEQKEFTKPNRPLKLTKEANSFQKNSDEEVHFNKGEEGNVATMESKVHNVRKRGEEKADSKVLDSPRKETARDVVNMNKVNARKSQDDIAETIENSKKEKKSNIDPQKDHTEEDKRKKETLDDPFADLNDKKEKPKEKQADEEEMRRLKEEKKKKKEQEAKLAEIQKEKEKQDLPKEDKQVEEKQIDEEEKRRLKEEKKKKKEQEAKLAEAQKEKEKHDLPIEQLKPTENEKKNHVVKEKQDFEELDVFDNIDDGEGVFDLNISKKQQDDLKQDVTKTTKIDDKDKEKAKNKLEVEPKNKENLAHDNKKEKENEGAQKSKVDDLHADKKEILGFQGINRRILNGIKDFPTTQQKEKKAEKPANDGFEEFEFDEF